VALGCRSSSDRSAAPSVSVGAVASGAAPVVVGRASSASAFDLVATPDGLQLIWASEGASAGWLSQVELGQRGEPRGRARQIPVPPHTLGTITDLSATLLGQRLALAWLEQGPREGRAQAALIAPSRPPVVLDLGPAALVAEAARGNIAIAAEHERDRALVMWRGLEAPCVDAQTAPCTGFTFRRVSDGLAEASGLPLSVPVPCASHSVQLATAAGRFHYGVCTREGTEPVTTMFSIQYEPEYARAEQLLKGCLPLGTIEAADRAWLIGDCHGKRRAALVPLVDEKVVVESIDAPVSLCTPQRLELRQGRFSLQLREPRAGLDAALPASLVPTGARVGWTGSTLLVVYLANLRLETRAYACRDGKLQPLP